MRAFVTRARSGITNWFFWREWWFGVETEPEALATDLRKPLLTLPTRITSSELIHQVRPESQMRFVYTGRRKREW